MISVRLAAKLYRLSKPLWFKFQPETAHHFGLKFTSLINKKSINSSKELLNPFVLAAGFDKTALYFDKLLRLGFATIEVGSFTSVAQHGNDRPRVFRNVKHQTILNRMGFNNPGIGEGLLNIEKVLSRSNIGYNKIAISLGKSKVTPLEKAAEEYCNCIELIQHAVAKNRVNPSYIAVNISSPNTPNLRKLQTKIYFRKFILQVRKSAKVPLFLKFAPDFDNKKQFTEMLEVAIEENIDGLIISNTSNDITLKKKFDWQQESGGLSGEAIRGKALNALSLAVTTIANNKNHHINLVSSGSVMTPEDAFMRLLLGANQVQFFTGLIYYGPDLIYQSLQYLEEKLVHYGLSSLEQLFDNRSDILQCERNLKK